MAHNLLVVGLDDRVFNFKIEESIRTTALKGWLTQTLGEAGNNFHLTIGGIPLEETDTISCGQEWGTTLIRAHPLIRGGKGGFGALIRAVGSRANRSNNKEACRDLSGRRLRDVNAQKKVSKWLEDEPERKKRRREEKRKRLLQKKVPPKHFFDDQAYMEQLRSNEEGMDSALKQGLVASSSKGVKRKQPEASGVGTSGSKKPKLWMGIGMEGDDDASSDEYLGESEDGSRNGDEGGQGCSGIDQCPVLNSAGSSDEAGRSKPSDEEVESREEQPAQLSGPDSGTNSSAEILIPPLERNPEKNGDACEGSKTAEADIPRTEKDQQTSEESSSVSCEATNSEAASTLEQAGKVSDGTQNNTMAETKTVDSASGEETQPSPNGPLDLEGYSSAAELESVGRERLKAVLQSLGLKCGGTLQERAQRLFSTKGKSREELDPSLFAKAGKSRKRKNK